MQATAEDKDCNLAHGLAWDERVVCARAGCPPACAGCAACAGCPACAGSARAGCPPACGPHFAAVPGGRSCRVPTCMWPTLCCSAWRALWVPPEVACCCRPSSRLPCGRTGGHSLMSKPGYFTLAAARHMASMA